MGTTELKVIMPVGAKAWLRYAAKLSGGSMNAALLSLLGEAMRAEPLRIFVHEIAVEEPTLYTVSIGEWGDDIFETLERDNAVAFARAKIAELGLPKTALSFNTATEKLVNAA